MRGRKKSEATRRAILEAACEVFARQPFHEVLTDELSARLRMGKGTLYRHFGSKEDLYRASMLHGMREMGAVVERTLKEEAPLEQTVERLAREVIRHFKKRRDLFLLLQQYEIEPGPRQRREWQRARDELVDAVAGRLAADLRPDGGPQPPPRLAAEILLGMLRSVCLRLTPADRIDDLARLVANVFLRGVRHEEPVATSRRRGAVAREGRKV